MAEEIRQRVVIEGEAALAALQRLSQEQQRMASGVEAAGQAAESAARQVRSYDSRIGDLRDRLEGLMREQVAYERSLQDGAQASDAATSRAAVRQRQIERLTAVLANEAEVQKRTAEAIREAGRAQEEAGQREERAQRSRSEKLSTLRERLLDLTREQIRHERQVAQGAAVDAEAAEQAARRQRQIDRVSGALANQAEVERRAGDAVRQHGKAQGDAAEAMDKSARAGGVLGDAVSGLVGRWMSFAAIGGLIISIFRDVTQRARESASAVADLGNQVRDLTANVGARQASQALQTVNQMAFGMGLNVQDRAEVLRGLSTMTDLREGMSQTQINEAAADLARLRKTTGVGGDAGARLLVAAQSGLGLSRTQSVETLAGLLTSGWDPEALAQTIGRVGDAGGLDMLALLNAARGENLDVNTIGRSSTALIGNLMRRDPRGRVAPELRRAGIREDMDPVSRIRALIAARRSGAIDEARFEAAIGGAENLRFYAAFERALAGGGMERSRAAMTDPAVTQRILGEFAQSPEVSAAERAARLEMEERRLKEDPVLAGENEARRAARIAMEKELRQRGVAEWRISGALFGYDAAVSMGFAPDTAASFSEVKPWTDSRSYTRGFTPMRDVAREAMQQPGVTININNPTYFDGSDPLRDVVDRGAGLAGRRSPAE